MARRAVFLDRDGVLNRVLLRNGKPHPPRSIKEMTIPQGVGPALARLRGAGFLLIVLTNQPDIARGSLTWADLDAMHEHMSRLLPLDAFRVCDHDDSSGCPCRKPKPGLIIRAANDFGIDRTTSFMVGDRWRDVDAGSAAGCRTVLIDMGYRERGPSTLPSAKVSDLGAAADWILAQVEAQVLPSHIQS
jgi:D-glycero-D-manno-heptose 1,7-bisphosphate phosphatase